MGKHSKPNSAKNISTSDKADNLIELRNDEAMFENGQSYNPLRGPGHNASEPISSQDWRPGTGPGKRGVKTKRGVNENINAALDMGFDPDKAQAVRRNLDEGRAFDDRRLVAPQDRGGDPSRRPQI